MGAKNGSRIQIHFLTAVILYISAAVLLWLNITPGRILKEGTHNWGWPLEVYRYSLQYKGGVYFNYLIFFGDIDIALLWLVAISATCEYLITWTKKYLY